MQCRIMSDVVISVACMFSQFYTNNIYTVASMYVVDIAIRERLSFAHLDLFAVLVFTGNSLTICFCMHACFSLLKGCCSMLNVILYICV